VGLLSDALESVVNLIAAVAALFALHVATQEPDEEHAYGHSKAEYFSSTLEGVLILGAAGLIVYTAIPRLINPVEIESLGIGLAVSLVAGAINLLVAWRLRIAATTYRSITLLADAKHLMVDVWTTAGVIAGIGLVAWTGWLRLDAIIALLVAANIVWTGYRLVRTSMLGLLDTAISDEDLATVEAILNAHREASGIQMHALRTRRAGARQFVSFHLLVPGEWTVQRGHALAEQVEQDIRSKLPGTTVFTHVEPIGDPVSWADGGLDGAPPEMA
jgi:cation diffusion facilitator family transporter